MGMYTELILGCKFKKNIPKDIVYTLAVLSDNKSIIEELEKEHNDLKMLWHENRNPLLSSSYYFIPKAYCDFWFDEVGNYYCIQSRSSLKNYNNEIEDFLTLIRPHIQSGVGKNHIYAYVLYEESSLPTIHSLYLY